MSLETVSAIFITTAILLAVYVARRNRTSSATRIKEQQIEHANLADQICDEQDPPNPPLIETARQNSDKPDIVEEIEGAIRRIQSSFENLDEVTKKSQKEVYDNTIKGNTSKGTTPDMPTVDNPDSKFTNTRLYQKSTAKTADKTSLAVRDTKKRIQKRAQVSRATGEAMQAIESLFIAFEDLADDAVKQMIRKETTRVQESHRKKTPAETFFACRRAFQAVSNAFALSDSNEVYTAIREVLAAIDNAIETVEAAFHANEHSEQPSARILETIVEATSVIHAATSKIKQSMRNFKAEQVRLYPCKKSKAPEVLQRKTDVFLNQKVTRKPEVSVTLEEVQATIRENSAKSRSNYHVEINAETTKLLNEFLAKIENKIDEVCKLEIEISSMATLKNKVEKYRVELMSSSDRTQKNAINEIAEQCKQKILSPSTNRDNTHAVLIGKVCMMATKSVLVNDIIESIVYSYEGKDVLNVKEASNFLIMRYVKEVAQKKLNSLVH